MFIEGLTIETLIGIYAGERDATQSVVIDLELGFDNTQPGTSGRIEDSIDYTVVVAALKTLVASSDCGLLEQLAEACCTMLRQRFKAIRSIDLRIGKPAAARALGCGRVGVRIQRQLV